MDIEVRPVADDDEFRQYGLVTTRAFGDQLTDEALEEERSVISHDRMLLARDGGQPVGTAGAYDFEMTYPGDRVRSTPGVTAVAVSPTHRRRGILTELMRVQLEGLLDADTPVAVLTASESNIYRRFGYGPACAVTSFEIDKTRSAFEHPLDLPGAVELRTKDEAASVVPEIYDRYRARRPGMLSRSAAWWRILLGDRESWRGGGQFYVAVHVGGGGEPDGYAFYSIDKKIDDGLWRGRVVVRELLGGSPDVEAALWRFCLDIDLCTHLTGLHRPVDEPLVWRLAEPRQLVHRGSWDMLWLRIIDVGGALAARGYQQAGMVTLEVRDPFLPRNDGRYRVETSPGGVSCERTGAEADVSLDISDLGSGLLAGVRFTQLARGGRLTELRRGAVSEMDRLFEAEPAPYCNTEF